MAEELRQQVPVIKEVLEANEYFYNRKAGLEADDLLNAFTRRKRNDRSYQETEILCSLLRSM